VNVWLPPDQVAAWGWRIPFVGSVLFLIVGYLLRRGITETAEGMKAAAVRAPLRRRSWATGSPSCRPSASSP